MALECKHFVLVDKDLSDFHHQTKAVRHYLFLKMQNVMKFV